MVTKGRGAEVRALRSDVVLYVRSSVAWLGRRNPPLWHSVQEPARGNRQPVAHLCEPQSLWAFIAGAG